MTIPTSVMMKLATIGLSAEQAEAVASMLSEVEAATKTDSEAVVEKSRSKARERVQRWRENKAGNVTERNETQRNGLCASDARGDVKQNNLEIPNSKKQEDADKPRSDLSGFKAELAPILNQERIDGLVSIRRKKKAPLTPYAGRLLVKALQGCGDVNVAADEMIVRNWTSIKPEWLEARNSSRSTGPPKQESDFARHQRECTEALERSVYGDRNDQPSSNGPAFDLEPGNWRPHGKAGSG